MKERTVELSAIELGQLANLVYDHMPSTVYAKLTGGEPKVDRIANEVTGRLILADIINHITIPSIGRRPAIEVRMPTGYNFSERRLKQRQADAFKRALEVGISVIGADMANTDLRDIEFHGRNIQDCSFEGCDLRNANFEGVCLVGVNLRNADLTGARINYETRLQGCIGLESANFGEGSFVIIGPTRSDGFQFFLIRLAHRGGHYTIPHVKAGCRWMPIQQARNYWGGAGYHDEDLGKESLLAVDYLENAAIARGLIKGKEE